MVYKAQQKVHYLWSFYVFIHHTYTNFIFMAIANFYIIYVNYHYHIYGQQVLKCQKVALKMHKSMRFQFIFLSTCCNNFIIFLWYWNFCLKGSLNTQIVVSKICFQNELFKFKKRSKNFKIIIDKYTLGWCVFTKFIF